MTDSISCYIGVSREAPYTPTSQLTPPTGTEIPRPFDIKQQWKNPVGRSSGGAYVVSDFESMTWMYTVGVDTLYAQLAALYNPANPWVWVYYYDLVENEGTWWEATMSEPRLDRGAGTTVANVSVTFNHMSKYVP